MSERGNRAASLLGTTLGRYEVKALIGRGAQGTVYLARDVVLNRSVALKVLLGSLAQDKDVAQAFHREAQTAAGLRHPSIVRVYSAGVQDGIPYISMEYVAGEPLDRFIKRHERIGWVSALYIGSQVADALDCAHRHGIVHRDVKPANILLDREGKAHLTDFGIARAATAAGAQGGFAGTLHYTSPEQCAGGPVGPASDLYSLGVTLFRLISGALPFDADSPVILMKRINTETAPRLNKLMPELPDDVARLVAHLLEKQPRARPADARAIIQRIERIQSEGGGRSVIAEALAAFVKEQAASPQTPTPLPGSPVSRRGRKKRPAQGTGQTRPSLRPRLAAAVAAVLICATGLVGALRASGALEPKARPPVLAAATFDEVEPGVLLVRLPYEGYDFESVRWVGDRPVVLVRVGGHEGTLTHGADGVFAIDVEGRRCWSVLAPTGPAMDDAFWDCRAPLARLHPIVAGATNAPLAESLLLPLRVDHNGTQGPYVSLVAQKWNDRAPGRGILFQAPLAAWAPSPLPGQQEVGAGCAVPCPDGQRMCLVLYDVVHESNYLVERHLMQGAKEQVGSPLTTMEHALIPGSVQYSPDGAQIAYMRETAHGQRELWLVQAGGNEVNGTLLARGAFEEECAFSPDGARILVAEGAPGPGGAGAPGGGRVELRVLSALDGTPLVALGPGRIGPDSWSPSGQWVAARAGDGTDGLKQLWRIDATGRGERKRLTNLRHGVRTAGAVSPGERWVAAVAETGGLSALVVVDLGAEHGAETGVRMAKMDKDHQHGH